MIILDSNIDKQSNFKDDDLICYCFEYTKKNIEEDYLQNGGQKPIWPDGKPFAVCLTHDVDAVSLYSFKQSLRSRKAQLLNSSGAFQKVRFLAGLGIDLAQLGIYAKQKGQLHCYERCLEVV